MSVAKALDHSVGVLHSSGLKDDGEFVAADACEGIAAGEAGMPCGRELDKAGIACGVPVPIVVALEIVEVDEEESALGAGPCREQALSRTRVQAPAIERSGEGITLREPAEPIGHREDYRRDAGDEGVHEGEVDDADDLGIGEPCEVVDGEEPGEEGDNPHCRPDGRREHSEAEDEHPLGHLALRCLHEERARCNETARDCERDVDPPSRRGHEARAGSSLRRVP